DARVAQFFGTLVNERMIDAVILHRLLRLLEQRVLREVDVPIGVRTLFGERARLRGIERFGTRVANIRLRYAPIEAVGAAVGLEANDGFLDFAGREQAHVPPIRRIEIAARETGERASAAAFELDVVLR